MEAKTSAEAKARLRRIAGQVGGIERMIDEQRYCVDILHQIAAVQAALVQTGKLLLASHIDTCLTDALRNGNERERRKKITELVEVFARLWRARDSEAAESASSEARGGSTRRTR